jgi:hypothetical protein
MNIYRSLSSGKYSGFFVTAAVASNFGVNDHNFVVDRKFADELLRGITEDYYLNKTLARFPWQNPEHRIWEVVLYIWSFVPVLRFIVTTLLYSQLSSHLLNNS